MTLDYSSGNIARQGNYLPFATSPQRENFTKESYFLDASLNKRSFVKSDVFKNYHDESKDLRNKYQCQTSTHKSSLSYQRGFTFKSETEANANFDSIQESFNEFTNGFKGNSIASPSYVKANRYLTLMLKGSGK